jgi:putative membrane protein
VKVAAYVGCLLGLALLITLVVRADLGAILHTWESGGWELLWLVPYRALYFLLYAIGWLLLLRPYNSDRRTDSNHRADFQRRADSEPRAASNHRAGLGYLFWATTVREAVDRLLPVASVGGSVVGVRLLRWRGIAMAPAGASVIVEIVLTLIVSYLFAGLGLLLLVELGAGGHDYHRLLLAFALTMPVPVISLLLLRYGSVFARLQAFLRPWLGPLAHRMIGTLVGASGGAAGRASVRATAAASTTTGSWSSQAAALDRDLRATLRRGWTLLTAGGLQFAALLMGSFEIWFALRLFGHPVDAGVAVVLESLTQAVRHLAFVIPAGLGVQEAGLVLFGQAFGIGSELALAVSMAKRMREILCGLPALISWQLLEGRRIHRLLRDAS